MKDDTFSENRIEIRCTGAIGSRRRDQQKQPYVGDGITTRSGWEKLNLDKEINESN